MSVSLSLEQMEELCDELTRAFDILNKIHKAVIFEAIVNEKDNVIHFCILGRNACLNNKLKITNTGMILG